MYKIIGANQIEYGPVTAAQLRAWITEGRADANTRVKLEGAADWQSLREFPEFADLLAPPRGPAAPVAGAGAPPTISPSQPTVPNYLLPAILVTLCCCLPFGIVAIVYSSQVNGKLAGGDYAGALAASRNARLWCWVSLGIGLVIKGLVILVQLTVGFASVFKQWQ